MSGKRKGFSAIAQARAFSIDEGFVAISSFLFPADLTLHPQILRNEANFH
jgi:hypothetical protein